MSLAAGSKLGPYEVASVIGAGGMGEVYRARDPRLGRDVAVKVLPLSSSADPDRLRRFEQEARAAAALNHPNILAVHDVGTHEGAPYLVSELLEGETLRERLSQSSRSGIAELPGQSPSSGAAASHAQIGLPVRRAIEFAAQIAHGLAAAHDKNLVHRDLKPENIFITTDSRVKILDFGLAKLTQPDAAMHAEPNLPTSPAINTEPGMLLGTIVYMSPEQVRGLPVDHRADIFAFGVILYEMLAGQRAFRGATSADTISAILKEDPPDLPVAERHIPPALERIVDRCMEKVPAARFQTATDLAFALESLSSHSDHSTIGAAVAPAPARRRSTQVAWIAAAVSTVGLLGAGIVTVIHFREAPPAPDPVRFQIPLPQDTVLGAPASQAVTISPDGRHVVFGALNKGASTWMLWVRPLAALEARVIPGTDNGTFPFWSPDSRSIAFFAGGKLKRVQLSGGPPIDICDAANGRGGAWAGDNTIIFAPSANAALVKVASGGGPLSPATSLENGETAHRWPSFLPDGRQFVYVAATDAGQGTGNLRLASLDSPERPLLGPSESQALYASGHLLFVRGGSLMAGPFDPDRRAIGEPFPIAEQTFATGQLRASFSASTTGVLAYRAAVALSSSRLTWFDRGGRLLDSLGDSGFFMNLALSSDDLHVAVSRGTGLPLNFDIWLIDLARSATPFQVTFDPASDFDPVFSPDRSRIVFNSARTSTTQRSSLYSRASDGSGQDELLKPETLGIGADWSHDGRFLAYTSAEDLWVMPLFGEGKPFPFQTTTFAETDPAISPDGRWLAYTSTESGQAQIFVQPFPAGGGKTRISLGGGTKPRWRGDGREIFFLAPDGMMMAAGIDTTKGFHPAVPEPLFNTHLAVAGINHPYVVTQDGKRFLFPVADGPPRSELTVVLNWLAGAQKPGR